MSHASRSNAHPPDNLEKMHLCSVRFSRRMELLIFSPGFQSLLRIAYSSIYMNKISLEIAIL